MMKRAEIYIEKCENGYILHAGLAEEEGDPRFALAKNSYIAPDFAGLAAVLARVLSPMEEKQNG